MPDDRLPTRESDACMSCGGNDGYGPPPHHEPGCYFASREDEGVVADGPPAREQIANPDEYMCPRCWGTGSIESSDSTDDRWWDCSACKGTGKLKERRRAVTARAAENARLREEREHFAIVAGIADTLLWPCRRHRAGGCGDHCTSCRMVHALKAAGLGAGLSPGVPDEPDA